MKIRTVTLGKSLLAPNYEEGISSASRFLQLASEAYRDEGVEVQTTRLAAQTFNELVNEDVDNVIGIAVTVEREALNNGIEYVSLGTILPRGNLQLISMVPDVLVATERASLSVIVADNEIGIHFPAIKLAARMIKEISRLTTNGFGNHRFAALVNCPSNIPFFPAGYHRGKESQFTLGLECADLFLEALSNDGTIQDKRDALVNSICFAAKTIEKVAYRLEEEMAIPYGGIDFSTATYPSPYISIAGAMEALGLDKFGSHGTLFAAACVTDAINRGQFRRAGFSGLFLPVMEDSVLAQRNDEEIYGIDSLLLYSAVCGSGLDTIPLPGDVDVNDLASIILDVATLGIMLDKPLTARLVPIPGKNAREFTDFDFPYYAKTRTMSTKQLNSKVLLNSDEILLLRNRRL